MRGLVRFMLATVLLLSLAVPVQAAASKLSIDGPVCDNGVVRITASSSWAPNKGIRVSLQAPDGFTYSTGNNTGAGNVTTSITVPFTGAGSYGSAVELYRWTHSGGERQVDLVTVFATINSCPTST
ncbi:MAG TPA: hypothetical protein VFI15_05425 [Candidatus Limnocylindrales bacterium]|nr:hypothetical protein [Candidatus Limnocylindrales bacterium]